MFHNIFRRLSTFAQCYIYKMVLNYQNVTVAAVFNIIRTGCFEAFAALFVLDPSWSMSRIKELLIVTEEDVKKVLKYYNKTEDEMKQDVNILKEWLRQEAHLPKDEGMFEYFFID